MSIESQFESVMRAKHEIKQLSEYQYRIDGRFDVFPNSHGRAWQWHDIQRNRRGEFELNYAQKNPNWKQILEYLSANPPAPKPATMMTTGIRWGHTPPKDEFMSAFEADPLPEDFEARMKEIWALDWPWEKVWKEINREIEERCRAIENLESK